jgi:acyl-CoA reductase-like NAD-dependent aldehyde dehydrogenase
VDIFHEAGLPDGCLNLIFHRPEDASKITNALIAHPAVKKINFTGSTAVGSIVAGLAGKHLKPIITELGGKASAIVLQAADIKKAAAACTVGSFLHAGQVCMATERVIVHSSIADPFIAAFKECTNSMYGASGPAPLFVSATGAKKTKALVQSALSKGTSVVLGDPKESTEPDSASCRMRPIILTNVAKGSSLYESESFGPAVAVHTFETEGEALAIANDTDYGLSGAVFTENLAVGLRIARGYETGAVHINGMTIHDETSLPHGGVKKSGFGRFNGLPGLEEFLRSKVVTWKD